MLLHTSLYVRLGVLHGDGHHQKDLTLSYSQAMKNTNFTSCSIACECIFNLLTAVFLGDSDQRLHFFNSLDARNGRLVQVGTCCSLRKGSLCKSTQPILHSLRRYAHAPRSH